MMNRNDFIKSMVSIQATKELRKKGCYGKIRDKRDKYNCGSPSSGDSRLPSRKEWDEATTRAYREYVQDFKSHYRNLYGVDIDGR